MLKLRRLSLAYSAILLATLCANGVIAFLVMQAQDHTAAADAHRRQAVALVLDLQREVGALAHFVRAFTTTGEIRYLSYYYDILAIRNGEKAIPESYWSSSYWDEVVAGNLRHNIPPGGVKKSLQDRMGELGFDATEFAALQAVLEATETVKGVEQVAFAATQGLYDPASRSFVSEGRPNLAYASQLVHGPVYNQGQASLARAVERLVQVTEQRTSRAAEEASANLKRWITVSALAALASVLVVVVGFIEMNQRLLRPVQQLRGTATRLAGGRYDTRTAIENSVEELHLLGQTMDEMAKSIQEDIFHRESSQRALEEARSRAEAATEAKSLFLANMSHEIRTPMNAILGMSYLALGTDLSPRQRDYVEKVHASAKVLLGIINDILDFSKIEAGKMELEKTLFQFDEVLSNAMTLVRQRAEEKNIELIYELRNASLAERQGLIGDPLRLGQILVNLLSNAIKFTEQGQVTLAVDCLEQDDQGMTVSIEVSDTGIGMSPLQQSRLFREFTQADGSITRKFGGTGLGLAITKRLCELMGGTIHARSELGKGSTFTVTVRLAKAPAGESSPPPVDFTALRVLLVDDNASSREVICRLLATMGFGRRNPAALRSAASGAEAVRLVEEACGEGTPFDLLLLDWVMPDMSGDAVLQELTRRSLPLPATTAIISAFDSDLLRHSAQLPAGCHVLPKPILPADLFKLYTSPGLPIEPLSPTNPPSVLEGMRLLLVEDNLLNQQLAREILAGWGIEVDVSNNGQEALEQLTTHPADYYDLVLLDLQMPVLDGYQTASRLRAMPAYAGLPLVAMSAHTLNGEDERCLALGMNGHIGKPFEPEQLFQQIAFFSGRQGRQPEAQEPVAKPGDRLLAHLGAVQGLDVAVGLRRSARRPDLYRRVLIRFREDVTDVAAELKALFEHGKLDVMARRAHTLKGIAGTVGALDLSTCARELEDDIRAAAPSAVYRRIEAIAALVAPLVAALADLPAIDENSPATPPAVPAPSVSSNLQRLRELLAEGDTDAIECWRDLPPETKGKLHVGAQNRLARALENFDFDLARQLLDGEIGENGLTKESS